MRKLKIDNEFQGLIPKITETEYTELERSITTEGCRDALVLWGDTLIDGHNRYEICQLMGVSFKTRSINLENRESAKLWIINNQLARRNLTSQQMRYLRGIRHNLEKQKGTRHSVTTETAERLGKEYGVSGRTIKRDAKFAQEVDKLPEEEKLKVLSGERKLKPEPESEYFDGEEKLDKMVEEVKQEKEIKKKESFNLQQLKYFWKRANKTDRKRFVEWANLKFK
jgi:hypothetical protein